MDAGPVAIDDMWHVTLTVAGAAVPRAQVRAALERLSEEHPFLLSGRYDSDRAEVRYWEQAASVDTVLSLAEHLWAEHADTAGLPPWRVVGVEVIDRETFHRRGRHLSDQTGLVAAGSVVPF